MKGGHADPAEGIDEALALLAVGEIDVRRLFDRIDDAVLVEARAGDLAEAYILRARSAEQKLVILNAFPVDTENADIAGMNDARRH